MQQLLSEPKRHVIFPSQSDRVRIDAAFKEVIDEWVAKKPRNASLLNLVRSEIRKLQSRH
ncbi:MAG: C4-dicarboxylate ABC transporter substrate-binding protein, partial [Tardiphaga sp.]